jgi:hypothetical protein
LTQTRKYGGNYYGFEVKITPEGIKQYENLKKKT